MKKIKTFSVIASFLFISQLLLTEHGLACSPNAGIWVKFQFTFHRPKLDCLKGFGLCLDITSGFDGSGKISAEKACPVRALITENKQLIVEITEEDLSIYEGGSTIPYFRGKTSITLEDPYTLSAETTRALGFQSPVTIKAGTYPLKYEHRVYTVIFQL